MKCRRVDTDSVGCIRHGRRGIGIGCEQSQKAALLPQAGVGTGLAENGLLLRRTFVGVFHIDRNGALFQQGIAEGIGMRLRQREGEG